MIESRARMHFIKLGDARLSCKKKKIKIKKFGCRAAYFSASPVLTV
jgi:hypothetical protein